MSSGLEAGPTATTFEIETLALKAWEGSIRVPHFQRDFRWGWEDVRRLFDSVLRGYPVGSLLLWQREASEAVLQLGGLLIDAPASGSALWVVDGQQRLTSIANALHPEGSKDPRFALSYDLEKRMLIRPPAALQPHVVPLATLFDLQAILKWFASNPGAEHHFESATLITKRLRQFKVPGYLVESQDTAVLQDIFDRMNNYGKRLSRAEVFSALTAGGSPDSHARTLTTISRSIDEASGFGLIDQDTVLAAILARRGPAIRRDIRKEFDNDNDEGQDAAFKEGEAAILAAVRFLQNDAGVPHYSFLPYKHLLVVLSRYFALFPNNDSRSRRLLRRWFWRAAVGGPEHFKGGTPNVARILCAKIVAGEQIPSTQRLLSAVSSPARTGIDTRRFSTSEANSKILLAALWSLSPRDPETGEEYTRGNLAEVLVDAPTSQPAVQYVVPRSLVPEQLRPWAANRVLLPSWTIDPAEVATRFSSPTLTLGVEDWIQTLHSHAMTEVDATSIAAGDFTEFISHRQRLIDSHVDHFLDQMCEWDFQDTPSLASLVLDDSNEAD